MYILKVIMSYVANKLYFCNLHIAKREGYPFIFGLHDVKRRAFFYSHGAMLTKVHI